MSFYFREIMGLEVSVKDVEELMDEHNEELITDQLQDHHLEVQDMTDEKVYSNKGEETGENVLFSELKDIFSVCGGAVVFVTRQKFNHAEKNHAGKVVAKSICDLFNDNVLPYFRQILKRARNKLV